MQILSILTTLSCSEEKNEVTSTSIFTRMLISTNIPKCHQNCIKIGTYTRKNNVHLSREKITSSRKRNITTKLFRFYSIVQGHEIVKA